MPNDRADPTSLWAYKLSDYPLGFGIEDEDGPLPLDGVEGRFQLRAPDGTLIFEATTETDGGMTLDDPVVGEVSVPLPAEIMAFDVASWGLELDGDVIVAGRFRLRDRVVADG